MDWIQTGKNSYSLFAKNSDPVQILSGKDADGVYRDDHSETVIENGKVVRQFHSLTKVDWDKYDEVMKSFLASWIQTL